MKRALIVGINYTGTGNDLRGCLNDAYNMKALFEQRGFDEIKMILEKDATTAGIKAGLDWLVTGTVPGDVIVFHYSGHGSQLPSKKEKDGFEEIICPIDLNWTTRVITDDTLREVFDRVPKGCNTTLILDCCHSGDALDQDEGASANGAPLAKELVHVPSETSRALEFADRYLAPPEKISAKLETRELVEWVAERDVNDSALLIAGSHSSQTSADALIDGVWQGAATYALLQSVKAKPDISYKQLIDEMTSFMVSKGYTQRPELGGFSGLYPETFAQPFGWADEMLPPVAIEPVVEAPAPVEPVVETPEKPKIKADKTLLVIIVVMLLLGFILMQ